MRQLNKIETAIFLTGALLMVIGAGASLLQWAVAPYVFAVGALGFASMQMQQRYDGQNFTIRRLRRIMLLSDVLLIVAAALMFADYGNPFGLDQLTWLQYVHNNWVVVLLIAAVMQLYTVFRIDSELRQEAKKR